MSAFIVSKEHVSLLAAWAYRRPRGTSTARRFDFDHPEDLANLLYAENAKSVDYRYQLEPSTLDVVTWQDVDKAGKALHRLIESGRAPVQILKACHCLEYQSCEHPGWEDSQAKRVLNAIKHSAIDALPGYSEADWEWSGEAAKEGIPCA